MSTSVSEDLTFQQSCEAKTCTFESSMFFLRKDNNMQYRTAIVQARIPIEIKQQVEMQCRLEGLI